MGRPRHRWEDNIRKVLEEIGINTGNLVDSAQDRNYWRALMNAALNLRVPYAMELVRNAQHVKKRERRTSEDKIIIW